jgi:hypothetical protein
MVPFQRPVISWQKTIVGSNIATSAGIKYFIQVGFKGICTINVKLYLLFKKEALFLKKSFSVRVFTFLS